MLHKFHYTKKIQMNKISKCFSSIWFETLDLNKKGKLYYQYVDKQNKKMKYLNKQNQNCEF